MVAYNPRVVFRRQSRVLGPKRRHDPPQTQIHSGGHKRRPDGQAANLHKEPVLIPGVVRAHDAAGVPDDLAEQTQQESDIKGGPRAGEHPDDDVSDQGGGVDGEEGGVGGEGDAVLVEGLDVVADGGGWVVVAVLGRPAVVDPGCVGEVGVVALDFDDHFGGVFGE